MTLSDINKLDLHSVHQN